MDFVRQSIEAFYRFEVTVPAPLPLPQEAYYAPRRRYRAERLLDFLQEVKHEEGDRIMGITAVDISTTKDGYEDWGILGLATLDGTVCVISTFRTGPRDADAPLWKKERATIRLGKTVVHELGHNLGLPHCPHRGCILEDAMGSVSTTDREYTFCDDCLRTLMETHPDIVVPHPVPPWPQTTPVGP